MLTTGFTLAVLTSAGFLIIYFKLPARIRQFMCKHVLLTDGAAVIVTYMLFGTNTIVGLLAAAFAGLIVSVNLALVNNPDTARIIQHLGQSAGKAKNKFTKWAAGKIASQEEQKQPELKMVA